MTHPSYSLYCVHTDEKNNRKHYHSGLNGVTIWEGPRMQRFERASALRYTYIFPLFSLLSINFTLRSFKPPPHPRK
jgi:hypothetical protein